VTSRKSTSSSVDHGAVLAFEYDDTDSARTVEHSLRPEIGEIGGDRTSASLERTATTVRIEIDAADLVALRAGCNTWSTLLSVAERVGTQRADAD